MSLNGVIDKQFGYVSFCSSVQGEGNPVDSSITDETITFLRNKDSMVITAHKAAKQSLGIRDVTQGINSTQEGCKRARVIQFRFTNFNLRFDFFDNYFESVLFCLIRFSDS